MKVILLRDVAKIGKRYEVVQVPDGFALNKLIPRKDAEAATPVNLKKILERQKNNDRSEENEVALLLSIHQACVAEPLQIKMEANEQGHLFQAIRPSDVLEAASQRGLTIPATFIKIDSPIKTVGAHDLRLGSGAHTYSLPIIVTAKSK